MSEPFTRYSEQKLRQYLDRIQVCLGKLTADQVWARGHETENSAANLLLHLEGNLRQWILSGVAGRPDTRDRDSEFAARGGIEMEQLREQLYSTVDQVCGVIRGLTTDELARVVRIQGFEVTVLEAVYQIVEHFAYHTGQIVFITKAATGEDLGFHRFLAHNRAAAAETVP